MGYTRGMLNGFANQISSPEEQDLFRKLIRKIPFQRQTGSHVEHCDHHPIEITGIAMCIENLTKEFFLRFMEFTSEDDLDSISTPITAENIHMFTASLLPEISDEQLKSN